jgi:hypothetical protein
LHFLRERWLRQSQDGLTMSLNRLRWRLMLATWSWRCLWQRQLQLWSRMTRNYQPSLITLFSASSQLSKKRINWAGFNEHENPMKSIYWITWVLVDQVLRGAK